jgi:hypothetical protein
MKRLTLLTLMLIIANVVYPQKDSPLQSIMEITIYSRTNINKLSNQEFFTHHKSLPLFNYYMLLTNTQNTEMRFDTRYSRVIKLNGDQTIPGEKTKRIGKILTFSGAAIYALTWGIVLSDESRFKGSGVEAFPLSMVQGAGFYSMVVGIPMWIVGKKRMKKI